MIDFREFPKIARLSRLCTVTEKIDGTNASVYIGPGEMGDSQILATNHDEQVGSVVMKVGSRTRWITPNDDNHGFARWAQEHAEQLWALGPGHHFGEWWGQGIQRKYGLTEKRWSLFNTHRWSDDSVRPACCHVVPVLATGVFSSIMVEAQIERLRADGSVAAPGFMKPEGVVVWHDAACVAFKKTLDKDEEWKGKSA